jgi:hypothetical protein
MLLRFKQPIAGQTTDGTPFGIAAGTEAEWPDEEEARRFVEQGVAEPARADAAETATLRRARK